MSSSETVRFRRRTAAGGGGKPHYLSPWREWNFHMMSKGRALLLITLYIHPKISCMSKPVTSGFVLIYKWLPACVLSEMCCTVQQVIVCALVLMLSPWGNREEGVLVRGGHVQMVKFEGWGEDMSPPGLSHKYVWAWPRNKSCVLKATWET